MLLLNHILSNLGNPKANMHWAISAVNPVCKDSEVNQKPYVTSLHIKPRNATL